jgi:hypothetical protein
MWRVELSSSARRGASQVQLIASARRLNSLLEDFDSFQSSARVHAGTNGGRREQLWLRQPAQE